MGQSSGSTDEDLEPFYQPQLLPPTRWLDFSHMLIKYRTLLWAVRLLVRSRQLHSPTTQQEQLDPSRPIFYLLPYSCNIDLLALRQYAIQHDLPDPLGGPTELSRTLFIDEILADCQRNRSIETLLHHLELKSEQQEPDAQLVLVTVLWGRKPGSRFEPPLLQSTWRKSISKFLTIARFGRDCFIHTSKPLDLQAVAGRYGHSREGIIKAAQIARVLFSRRCLAATGPRITERSRIIQQLLDHPVIAAEATPHSRKGEPQNNRLQAKEFLEEIVTDFSPKFIRYADRLFSLLWNRLYHGIDVAHVEPVRQLALRGEEIIYLPCHRSHMDYLLLSYVLYYQGLAPPYIAAGINLNFWPAGYFFRRTGAFFLRRSFRGNRLYSAVFALYLAELLRQGFPVEYFIEGGRSRSGHLLSPQTGLLTMTVQTVLENISRPITIVPVYIGYEHVVEDKNYASELSGADKNPENLLQVIKTAFNLRELGRAAVNFGEPIRLNSLLRGQLSNEEIVKFKANQAGRLSLLPSVVGRLAQKIMVSINCRAALNATNLCATALLGAPKNRLEYPTLVERVGNYVKLLRALSYTADCMIPDLHEVDLVKNMLTICKIKPQHHNGREVISISIDQADTLNYYRNNIQHLVILPALVARVILSEEYDSKEEMTKFLQQIQPILQAEFFLNFAAQDIPSILSEILNEFRKQELIKPDSIAPASGLAKVNFLAELACGADLTICYYASMVSLLGAKVQYSRREFEAECLALLRQLLPELQIVEKDLAARRRIANLHQIIREQVSMSQEEATDGRLRADYLQLRLAELLPNGGRQVVAGCCQSAR